MMVNRKFIIGIVTVTLLVFALQLQMPRKFEWGVTFSPVDRNPFGCWVMDSVMRQALPKGYEARRTTLTQMALSKDSTCNILRLTNTYPPLDSLDIDAIKRLTARGQHVMLVANSLDASGADTAAVAKAFGATMRGYDSFSLQDAQRYLSTGASIQEIATWHKGANGYPAHRYRVLYAMTGSQVSIVDSVRWEVLAGHPATNTQKKHTVLAATRRMGRGRLTLVSMPLLFSNYGIVVGDHSALLFRLMSGVAGRKVVRLTQQETTDEKQALSQTPLRVLLQFTPLRWALYLSVAVLLLFFVFTARRRQRVIPVTASPVNHTLEFTQLVGTLFYLRHDRTALVRRKWALFANALRRTAGVDVEALDHDDHLFTVLAERTALSYEDVARRIKHLRYLVANENNLSVDTMRRAISQMDDMLRRM